MSKIVQWKRGNTTASSSYVGAEGEITVDTTQWTLYVHDGVTAGGYRLATGAQFANISSNIVSTLSSFGSNSITTTGNIQGNTSGFAIGYRDVPQVVFNANATITTTDAGKHYYSTSSGNLTLTIANNASQAFNIGATIKIVNLGTGNITVAQGSGVTLYLAGNSTASNRTLAGYGTGTIQKVAVDTWFLTGVGIT